MTRHRCLGSLWRALLLAILAQPGVAAASVGALNDDLVYVPVRPCRVIDTRLLVGDPFEAGEQRDYKLIGRDDFVVYGGANSDCGLGGPDAVFSLPHLAYNIPRALVLNFVAVGSLGPGHFTAWPTGGAVPNASILNYGSSPGIIVANGVVVTTCGTICVDSTPPFTCDSAQVCPAGDLSVRAAVSSSHLVVDVMGYFRGADTSSLKILHSEGVAAENVILDGSCQTVALCSITAPAGESGRVLVTAAATVRFGALAGALQEAHLLLTSSGSCGIGSTRPGVRAELFLPDWSSGASLPAGLTGSFALNAGATGTYTLKVQGMQGYEGIGAEDEVQDGVIECLFIP
jgi:hypothetical protein